MQREASRRDRDVIAPFAELLYQLTVGLLGEVRAENAAVTEKDERPLVLCVIHWILAPTATERLCNCNCRADASSRQRARCAAGFCHPRKPSMHPPWTRCTPRPRHRLILCARSETPRPPLALAVAFSGASFAALGQLGGEAIVDRLVNAVIDVFRLGERCIVFRAVEVGFAAALRLIVPVFVISLNHGFFLLWFGSLRCGVCLLPLQ